MGTIAPRKTQTRIKHEILESYLGSWGGIILNGLRRKASRKIRQGEQFRVRFVYVDCNAYCGRYDGELEDDVSGRDKKIVFGSPIIGIRALDSLRDYAQNQCGISLSTNATLIEKNPNCFEELKYSMKMAKLDHRVRQTDDFYSLADSEVAILQADSTELGRELVTFTQSDPYTWSFFFMDPWGPQGIPLNFVGEIIRQDRHDAIIYMPYLDLQRKTGYFNSKLTTTDEKVLRNYDRMFGHRRWRKTVRESEEDLEENLAKCYRKSLESVDSDLNIKKIPLRFPDKDRTMYYLYLTTHDPGGALRMNKVLADAGRQEHLLRRRLREARKTLGGVQTTFLDKLGELKPQQPSLERPSREEIAQNIHLRFAGQSIQARDIYRSMVNELYFRSEIDKALRHLRKKGLASFSGSSIKYSTSIDIT